MLNRFLAYLVILSELLVHKQCVSDNLHGYSDYLINGDLNITALVN